MIPARVLIVEDERVVAMHLRQQLSRLGYHVPAMATGGAQALQQIALHHPDVVLMDIHIEGDLDGIETASRIPSDLSIPVIYLSAFSEETTLERARNTRPYGYLLKPFSERELHAAIQMVLERRRADRMVQKNAERLEELVAARTDALVTAGQELRVQTAQRLSAERALLQSQKMDALGQLTGGVAHDFNNLMQVVVGNLDVLVRMLPETQDAHRKLAGKALGGARKAAELTQRLLAFARRQPLAPKPVHADTLVAGMLDLLRRALGETISVDIAVGPDLWLIETDLNQLENAILNLALNARDAMQNGGTLTIETENATLDTSDFEGIEHCRPGEYVRIGVSDTGTGMDAKTKLHAFEPFFTTKEVGQGTGLGLSQVHGFLSQSHGHVRLDSEVGAGTCVSLFFPRFVGSHKEETASAPPHDHRKVGTETILIVEDDPDVRAFSVESLRDLGYTVLEAADGRAALQLLGRRSPPVDLLFTDVVLPGGMNGAILASGAMAMVSGLKVLYATGYARDALVHDGRLEPGVELLRKPFTYGELAARVREILDGPQHVAAAAS